MMTSYPKRIICMTEETTEALYLMGESDRIVGISGYTVRPAIARKEKPKISAFTSAKIDKILALEPELVLGFSDMQADIAAELIRAGVEVHIFNQRSIDEIFRMLLTLGSLIGEPQKAQDLIAQLSQNIAEVKVIAENFDKQPKVYFEEWYDPLICGIQWVSELIEIAGGSDIMADQAHYSLGKDRIIADPTTVIERNPDIIIGSWCGRKFRPEKVAERAGWQAINAVQQQQLFEIKSADILQPGPACLSDGVNELSNIFKQWVLAK
ncbi:MAG: cobalamin-binding protein [Gammaproteobacteria bacterium]|nr:cobalamin-binding protein [Gammaproteobacteria bacterium]NVK86732.1 cobalamin-binding protein [Gammaproteobacteria bacterium]